MSTLHMPKRLVLISQSFKASDPGAWITLVVAIGLLAVMLSAIFYH